MSTFQYDLNLGKTSRRDAIKLTNTKRSSGSKMLSLTQRGQNQAHRNDSTEMWKLINNWQDQTQADSLVQSSSRQQDFIDEKVEEKSFKRSQRHHPQNSVDQIKQENVKSKENSNGKSISLKKEQYIGLKLENKQNNKKRSNFNENSQTKNPLEAKLEQKFSDKESNKTLNLMNEEILKHLSKQKFASRTLSNSAFAKLYNRPCIQTYGYGNTSKESRDTNNFLKTHNITPHTNQNHPQSYQTYKTALMYAKRSRLNEEDKQQRVRRQFLKWFDKSIVQAARSELNNKNQQRKAKSEEKIRKKYVQMDGSQNEENDEKDFKQKIQKNKDLKELLGTKEPAFVYRHKDKYGSTILSRDRHGISCYVDPGFLNNEHALDNLQKNQRPIYPEKVAEEDMHLDAIRKQNFKKSIQEDHPGHYLVSCVVTPYDKSKYQLRKKRAESTAK